MARTKRILTNRLLSEPKTKIQSWDSTLADSPLASAFLGLSHNYRSTYILRTKIYSRANSHQYHCLLPIAKTSLQPRSLH